MSTLWVVFSISVVGLLFLVFLFRVEEKKGRRVALRRTRAAFDLLILKTQSFFRKMLGKVNWSFARKVFHFVINRFLKLLIMVVGSLESVLKKLQRTNQQVARTTIANSDSHLGEVREHTSAFRMSPEEKRQKRRELLE